MLRDQFGRLPSASRFLRVKLGFRFHILSSEFGGVSEILSPGVKRNSPSTILFNSQVVGSSDQSESSVLSPV